MANQRFARSLGFLVAGGRERSDKRQRRNAREDLMADAQERVPTKSISTLATLIGQVNALDLFDRRGLCYA